MAEQEGKTIHSVAKAIRLLDILTESGQPASLTELYQKTGWPKSTIHGLLSTMRESGLIEQMPNGRYWLGIRLFEYGCAVSNSWDIGTIARPHMQSICAELGESVFLSVFDRAAVVTLAEEESRASLRVVSEVGARLPVYCTSQGKLFLANSSPAECRRILTHTELKAFTPHTLTTPEQFVPELTRIREQGYAVENGEYKIGLRSVSAPIHDVTGEVRHRLRRNVPAGAVRRVSPRHPPRLRRSRDDLPRHRLSRVRKIRPAPAAVLLAYVRRRMIY